MKRIEWIDSLKGYGILCVTLGHLACNIFLETYIYSFHMFLFFFLSGLLHNKSDYNIKDFIAKKTRTILVPFLFWNIASLFAGLILNITILESIRDFLLLDGEVCWNAPIWFLLLLYMTEILYFFIDDFKISNQLIVIVLLFLFWMFIPGKNVFLKVNILPVCLLFYMFGGLTKKYYIFHLNSRDKTKKMMLASIILFATNVLFGVFLNKRISFTGADFGNVLYCGVAAMAGVLFYVNIFKTIDFLKNNVVLQILGKNSLIIMATQYWAFNFFDFISYNTVKISVWHYRSTLKAVFLSIITIFIILTFVQILKKLGLKYRWIKTICTYAGINIE